MSSPLVNGWTLVGTADGIQLATPGSGTIPPSEQHFLVEVWRFPEGPLRFDANATNLAVHVRISWPYHIRGVDAASARGARDQFTFNLALDR
ncbi:MAG: hypothetical protein ABIV50_13990 [Opitutus sp.]